METPVTEVISCYNNLKLVDMRNKRLISITSGGIIVYNRDYKLNIIDEDAHFKYAVGTVQTFNSCPCRPDVCQ